MSPGRGRPPQPGIAQARRAQITEAAYVVFAAQGYEDTTIEEIARQAGLGHGTVYRYFASKSEILHSVFDYSIERLLSAIELEPLFEPAESLADLLARVQRMCAGLPELLAREPELVKLIMVEAGAADDELLLRLRGLADLMMSTLARALAEGQAAGWVRAEVNPQVYAHTLMSLSIPGLIRVVRAGQVVPAELTRYMAVATLMARSALAVDRP
ncbi:TetR/AcrR family transcriptional regulator [Nocardia sp. XZ_19_385]|uniref:TetR/AcrR family transcriptional regulator n=1 Tax=Nocardia sp. XZ_19_385 TaxID=2769488 RepID=UPI0018903F26|nr:TetR/AcrR family transcriptional regulator [Nocardia sp. XZ_19_385]